MPVPEHGDPIKSNASSGVNEKPSFLELAKELRWQRAAVMLLAKKVGEDPGELFKAAAILLNGEAEID